MHSVLVGSERTNCERNSEAVCCPAPCPAWNFLECEQPEVELRIDNPLAMQIASSLRGSLGDRLAVLKDLHRLSSCVLDAIIAGINSTFDKPASIVSTVKVGILHALWAKGRKYRGKVTTAFVFPPSQENLLAWLNKQLTVSQFSSSLSSL